MLMVSAILKIATLSGPVLPPSMALAWSIIAAERYRRGYRWSRPGNFRLDVPENGISEGDVPAASLTTERTIADDRRMIQRSPSD